MLCGYGMIEKKIKKTLKKLLEISSSLVLRLKKRGGFMDSFDEFFEQCECVSVGSHNACAFGRHRSLSYIRS